MKQMTLTAQDTLDERMLATLADLIGYGGQIQIETQEMDYSASFEGRGKPKTESDGE